ncbi:MAG: hypothetical protein K0U59_07540 [Gammaproteobacteria bacterium]|nr:hypothetical protein [Gammaproteobacteria bacterium]
MIKEEVQKNCDQLPVLQWQVPKNGLELNMILRPEEAVKGVAQYWPFYLENNPGEEFGHMAFRFGGRGGKVSITLTLDLSAVPGRDLEFCRSTNRNLDGLLALSPDFKHQFRAKAKRIDAKYTQLNIFIKDNAKIPDKFSFLWLCESVDTGMHFVSGDPGVHLDPE